MHFEAADEYSTPCIFFQPVVKRWSIKATHKSSHRLKDTFKMSCHKKLDYFGSSPKMTGGGQLTFGESPGIHPIWSGKASNIMWCLPARGRYIGSKHRRMTLYIANGYRGASDEYNMVHLVQVKNCILRWDAAASGELIHCIALICIALHCIAGKMQLGATVPLAHFNKMQVMGGTLNKTTSSLKLTQMKPVANGGCFSVFIGRSRTKCWHQKWFIMFNKTKYPR